MSFTASGNACTVSGNACTVKGGVSSLTCCMLRGLVFACIL